MFSIFPFTLSPFQKLCVLTHTHVINCRSTFTLDPVDNDSSIAKYDFDNPIYQAEDEGEEYCEVSGGISRLLQQEEKATHPHEEPVEVVYLGTDKDRKKIKRGAGLKNSVKER